MVRVCIFEDIGDIQIFISENIGDTLLYFFYSSSSCDRRTIVNTSSSSGVVVITIVIACKGVVDVVVTRWISTHCRCSCNDKCFVLGCEHFICFEKTRLICIYFFCNVVHFTDAIKIIFSPGPIYSYLMRIQNIIIVATDC